MAADQAGRKLAGRPLSRHTVRANAAKSAVRAKVEHPFAYQKGVMGLVTRTIGLARAHAAMTLARPTARAGKK